MLGKMTGPALAGAKPKPQGRQQLAQMMGGGMRGLF
jgi:hypothetical protein